VAETEAPSDRRKPLLLVGLGLLGVAGYELLQKPKPVPAPIVCGPGTHLEGGICVADPPVTIPPASGYRVTAVAGLMVRAGPGTGFAVRGSLQYNQPVTIACQAMGQTIVRSAVWDHITSPIDGWVSDWYVNTPVVGGFSPGLSQCSSVPGGSGSGSGGPLPGPVPTGKAPLSSLNQLLPRMIISTGCGWGDADYIVLARRSTATASPRFGKVWIRDKYTWDGLAAPRSAIWRVTTGLLYQIADAGNVHRAIVRNYGEGWTWDAVNASVWDTDMAASPGINRGGFSVLKTAAGYC
jgi:hypothetical protein